MFIFSDWHSVDDPRPSMKLLCEWDIIPVFIGIGIVNLRAREDLASECGFAFRAETPVTAVIETLRVSRLVLYLAKNSNFHDMIIIFRKCGGL